MDKEVTMKRKKAPDPHQRTFTGAVIHVLWRILAAVLAVCLFLGISGGVAAIRVFRQGSAYIEEDIKPIAHYDLNGVHLNQSSFILARDPQSGEYKEIRQLLAIENRIWVNFEEIPTDMINAAVAIEDKRFWEHDGVDWMRTLAASANMFIGGSTYGGSTLTQQLIKNLTGEKDPTVRRKLTEMFKALDFEKHYSKKEIITWYLNTIYLGEGAYGVKSAAHVYFGKELEELTTKECACIIGITNNPSRYDPYIYPENNEYRTLTILQQMFEQGYIEDRDTYDRISDQVLEFKSYSASDQKYSCAECGFEGEIDAFEAAGDYYICPTCGHENQFDVEKEDYYSWFEDTVIRDVSNDLAELKGITYEAANQMVTTGGFRIYSTLDLDIQAKLDSIYEDVENVPKTYSSQQLQSAAVVIDNESGDIVAMTGGVGKKEGNLTWNRATRSLLPAGSSIKPLTVYGPGIALGVITPGTAYEDSPFMQINGKDWPQNDNRKYSGWMLVNNGVAQSLNTIAVKVLADITPEVSFHFAREKLGLTSLVEYEEQNGKVFSDIDYAPLALGQLTHGVTVREMATAYATFPNQGVYRKARTYTRVEDAEGNLILDNQQQSHEVMDTHAAWYMVEMLRYASTYGTGANARFGNVPVAGKTGTSSDNRDRWYSGFTPKYTASVWCGYDYPEEVRLMGTSINPSVTMWKSFMSKFLEGMSREEIGSFVQPDDERYTEVQLCSQTGLLAGPKCSSKSVGLFASDVPEKTCDAHLEYEIQLCWPEGKSGKSYCACDDCLAYNKLINSMEFKALAVVVPELNRFKANVLEKKTLFMLKDGDETPTLNEVLEANEIDRCPVHDQSLYQQLRQAMNEAAASLKPEPEPEPEPEPNPNPDPEPDPAPGDD